MEPRTITSERDAGGEIRETHKRGDGSVALVALYRGDVPVHLRAFGKNGREDWTCELGDERPRCVLRDPSGAPLSANAVATKNHDARVRLDAARKLLAPPDHDEGHGHQHSHFKVPPPSKEADAAWQAKRSKAWAEAEPWFERVDALQGLGLPTVVATNLAKEELSSGFWVLPRKQPIDADEHQH